jgi:hypothetical protein
LVCRKTLTTLYFKDDKKFVGHGRPSLKNRSSFPKIQVDSNHVGYFYTKTVL